MKNKTLQNTNLKILTLTVMVTVFAISCTKKRPAAWPDGEAENVYEIASVESQVPVLTLSGENEATTASFNELQAVGEGNKLKVESALADQKLLPLFSDLFLSGSPGQSESVKFKVGSKFVTAFRLLTNS